jgi:NAD-dependent deacetylase
MSKVLHIDLKGISMIDAQLIERLRACKRAVIFTGAGISAESGIPTFRDRFTGLWERYDPEEIATAHGFAKNPRLVWDWHAHLAATIRQAKPNAGHLAVAKLQALLPKVSVITQNIDNLHQIAGSEGVLELHGSLSRLKAFVNPEDIPDPNVSQVICHVCNGYAIHEECDPYASKEDLAAIQLEAGPVPRCPGCGAMLRPDIVWFGEPLDIDTLDAAMEQADQCDLLICIGSSLEVQPAASIPFRAKWSKAVVIEINPEPTALSAEADIFLKGKAAELMPELIACAWPER